MTCFSVELGICMEECGVRSKVDVFVDTDKQVHVTYGNRQTSVMPILKEFQVAQKKPGPDQDQTPDEMLPMTVSV